MRPSDLALLRIPVGLSLSPDGQFIATALLRLDLSADDYRSEIWLLATGQAEPVQFTRGLRDSSPAWSPDGRWLAFLRRREPKDAAQLYLMPAGGGEPHQLAEHPLGVEKFRWSPDGKRIAYVARVPEPGRYERGPDAREPAKEPPRRITGYRYRQDNIGFIGDRPAHVFTTRVDPGPNDPVQISTGDWQFSDPCFTPDGTAVLFTSGRSDDERSLAEDLFIAPSSGGEPRRLTAGGTTVASPAVSPDGQTVYFLGTDQLDVTGRTTGLFALPVSGGNPTRLTDREAWELNDSHHEAPLIATDEGLLALAARRGRVEAVCIRYDGEVSRLAEGECMMTDISVGGGRIGVIRKTARNAGEVATIEDGQLRVLSDFGAALSRGTGLREMEEIQASAPDGYPVHGFLVRPAGPGPHPVLLSVHGGPFTQYGHTFFDEAQIYASAGYAVVLGNPRGSSGYGESHGRAIVGDWGNLDRADLLALLDAALTDPELDGHRVGVMGGSYGGFMASWLAGHDGSRRFRAAISERALNSWDSFTGSSDIGWFFGATYVGADPAAQHRQSPLGYVEGVDIPMLLIHSEQDWRCPIEQAQRMFVALKHLGREVEFLVFPGEGHELSRSGLPSHRVARFEAILDWWARQLPVR